MIHIDGFASKPQHILNTKKEVATHNNLRKKLINSSWLTNASTVIVQSKLQFTLNYSTSPSGTVLLNTLLQSGQSHQTKQAEPSIESSVSIDHWMLKVDKCRVFGFDCGICSSRHQKRGMCKCEEDPTNERRETLFGWPHLNTNSSKVETPHFAKSPKCKVQPMDFSSPQRLYELESNKTLLQVTHRHRPSSRRFSQWPQPLLAHLEMSQSSENGIHLQRKIFRN